jgi:hypothetical protein
VSEIERLVCESFWRITLNSDNFVGKITKIGIFNALPILNSIIGTPFNVFILVNPQAVAVSCQWSIENLGIIDAVEL